MASIIPEDDGESREVMSAEEESVGRAITTIVQVNVENLLDCLALVTDNKADQVNSITFVESRVSGRKYVLRLQLADAVAFVKSGEGPDLSLFDLESMSWKLVAPDLTSPPTGEKGDDMTIEAPDHED